MLYYHSGKPPKQQQQQQHYYYYHPKQKKSESVLYCTTTRTSTIWIKWFHHRNLPYIFASITILPCLLLIWNSLQYSQQSTKFHPNQSFYEIYTVGTNLFPPVSNQSNLNNNTGITKGAKDVLNLRQIPLLASVRISNNQTTPFLSTITKKPRICLSRETYKEWIHALFAFAPPAPNCSDVESFISNYKVTSPYWVYGTIILQRNENSTNTTTTAVTRVYHDAYEIVDSETKKPASGGRKGYFTKLWKDANQYRKLPPNLEMILYINDKPRVNRTINRLPVFVIAGYFPAGSGLPKEWLGYVPFPSHFFGMAPNDTPPDRTEFSRKRPVVFFRGRFSEICWSWYNLSDEYISTPRFKLANATKHAADRDVLDIALTGFAAVPTAEQTYIRQDLLDKFGIAMGDWVASDKDNGNAMMSLSVPGNGWPGATTMRAIISDTAMLKVVDESIDNEGHNRNMGEIYFPHLTPGVHFVPVDYETIASTAREFKNDTETLFQINYEAYKFSQSYLGYECALDIVELLAWRYYEYVQSGCASAFAHVQM